MEQWREIAEAHQRMRFVCGGVIRRMLHLQLTAAFASWRASVAAQNRLRFVCGGIVQRMLNANLNAAWNTWRYSLETLTPIPALTLMGTWAGLEPSPSWMT